MSLDIILILGITVLVLDLVYILLCLYQKMIEVNTVNKLDMYYKKLISTHGEIKHED